MEEDRKAQELLDELKKNTEELKKANENKDKADQNPVVLEIKDSIADLINRMNQQAEKTDNSIAEIKQSLSDITEKFDVISSQIQDLADKLDNTEATVA